MGVQIVANLGDNSSAVTYLLKSVDALGAGGVDNKDTPRFRPVVARMVDEAIKLGPDGRALAERLSLGDMMTVLGAAHGMSPADIGLGMKGADTSVKLSGKPLEDAAVAGILHLAGVRPAENSRFQPVAKVMFDEAYVTGDGRNMLQRLALVKPAGK